MSKYRQERLANSIREQISKFISKEIEFSDVLVTITRVEIDEKLNQAIINFSVLPSAHSTGSWLILNKVEASEKFEKVLRVLEKNRSHLQYLLMKKINIKPMPQIQFKIDRGLEKAAEIEKLLLKDKIDK